MALLSGGAGLAAATRADVAKPLFNQRFDTRFNRKFNQQFLANRNVPKPTGGPPTGGVAPKLAAGIARPLTKPPALGTVRSGPQRTGPAPGAVYQPHGGAGQGIPGTSYTPGNNWGRGTFKPGTAAYNAAKGLLGGQTPGTQGSPLDAAYLGNVNAYNLKAGNEINALNLQGSQAGTALQGVLGQLAYQQPRAQLALEEKANKMGSLYSTPYDQQQGDLGQAFYTKGHAATEKYTNLADAIAGKIAAIQGGEGVYAGQQALAAALRQANLAAKNPALGATQPAQLEQAHTRRPVALPRGHAGSGHVGPVVHEVARQKRIRSTLAPKIAGGGHHRRAR